MSDNATTVLGLFLSNMKFRQRPPWARETMRHGISRWCEMLQVLGTPRCPSSSFNPKLLNAKEGWVGQGLRLWQEIGGANSRETRIGAPPLR
jgi:hypothetical protein